MTNRFSETDCRYWKLEITTANSALASPSVAVRILERAERAQELQGVDVTEEMARASAMRLERAVGLLASVGLGGAREYQRGIAKLGVDAKAELLTKVGNTLFQDLHRLDCVALVNIPSASAARNVTWSTWTSTIGWPVKGFWNRSPEGGGASHGNSSVDIYPGRVPYSVGGSGGGGEVTVISCDRPRTYKMVPVLACGNDRGGVRLFNYPCYDSRAAFKQYHAHTSQVNTMTL